MDNEMFRKLNQERTSQFHEAEDNKELKIEKE